MNEHVEVKGYLVLRGKDAGSTSFVIPENKGVYRRHEKQESPQVKPILEQIKNELKRVCQNYDDQMKRNFFKEFFQAQAFSDLDNRTNEYLNRKLEQLKEL